MLFLTGSLLHLLGRKNNIEQMRNSFKEKLQQQFDDLNDCNQLSRGAF